MQEKNRIGQTLGNYRLEKLLGKGGYAEVYLAVHIHLEIQAAIKVLKLQEELDSLEQAKFLSEAKFMKGLDHSNIIKLYDYGIEMSQKNYDGSTPYLVMEYAPYGTLRHLCPHGERLPLPKVTLYVKQIAAGLQYAHNNNVTHLDIKPENMLVRRPDDIALSDFGIAVAGFNTSNLLEQQAELLRKMARGEQIAVPGTAPYLAPERLQGHTQRASDQYSLAAVAYEWLAGRRPFEGSNMEICQKLVNDPPPSLKKINPAISREIEQVVMRALAKDPSARYTSVSEFAHALDSAILASFSSASPQTPPVRPVQSPDMVSPLIRPVQIPDGVSLFIRPAQSPDVLSPSPAKPVQPPAALSPSPAMFVQAPDFVSPSPINPVRPLDVVSPPPVRPTPSPWPSPPLSTIPAPGPVSSFNSSGGMGQMQLPPSPTQSRPYAASDPTFDNVLGSPQTPKSPPKDGFAGFIDETSGIIDETVTKTMEMFVSDRYFVKTRRTRNFRLLGIPLNVLSAFIVLFSNALPASIILAVLGGVISVWMLLRCTISLKKPIALAFGSGVALWWGGFVASGVTAHLSDQSLAFPICFLVFAISLGLHIWYINNRLNY